jgi:hypothetical protein
MLHSRTGVSPVHGEPHVWTGETPVLLFRGSPGITQGHLVLRMPVELTQAFSLPRPARLAIY